MKTNPRINSLARELYKLSEKEEKGIWKSIARTLEKPSGSWASINLSRLNKITKKDEIVIVPGKILGTGQLDHPLEIYAFNASDSARTGIRNAKGKFGTIEEIARKNAKVKGVRIIK